MKLERARIQAKTKKYSNNRNFCWDDNKNRNTNFIINVHQKVVTTNATILNYSEGVKRCYATWRLEIDVAEERTNSTVRFFLSKLVSPVKLLSLTSPMSMSKSEG